MEIIWIARARADVRKIFKYIADRNPPAAPKMARRFQDATKPLAGNPEWGTRIEEKPGLHKIVVTGTKYLVIFYRLEPDRDRILVLRVIYGGRRWERQL